jgi:hypothetical protein
MRGRKPGPRDWKFPWLLSMETLQLEIREGVDFGRARRGMIQSAHKDMLGLGQLCWLKGAYKVGLVVKQKLILL